MGKQSSADYVLHDAALIRAALDQREELLQRYNRIKSDYRSAVKNLLNNWKGEGADAFRQDEAKIGKNIESIYDIMRSMSDMLVDCLTILDEKDKALGEYNANPK